MNVMTKIKQPLALLEVCLLLLLWLITAIYIVWQNQPHLPSWSKPSPKYECMSYAPYYRPDQTPQIATTYIAKEQIASDLKRLSEFTDCVRTYSVGQGLDVVPELAHQLGIQVILGAWVSWTDADNRKEIALAIKQANAYPETVKAIIIGNEVLLRQEQSESSVKAYLNWAQQQTEVPITYADVWEFWLKHPSIEEEVDFVTVHILPYWEDAPVAIEAAAAHTEAVMQKVSANFKKPLLIGETGWPSAGRQRFGAKPSVINQARYIREFLDKAHEHRWHYNVIEAIDQPWKRGLEGTVGGYWGVLDAHLKPKFEIEQPIKASNDGALPWLLSIALGLFFLAVHYVKSVGENNNRLPLARSLMIGAVFGFACYFQWKFLEMTSRDTLEWITLGGVAVLANALGVYVAINARNKNALILNWGVLMILLTMLGFSCLTYIDGRYRDFNTSLYVFPIIILGLHVIKNVLSASLQAPRLIDALPCGRLTFFSLLFGGIASALSILVWHAEPGNTSALVWAILVALTTVISYLTYPIKNECY